MFVKAREGELAHWLIKHCDIFLRFDHLLSLIIIAMQFLRLDQQQSTHYHQYNVHIYVGFRIQNSTMQNTVLLIILYNVCQV